MKTLTQLQTDKADNLHLYIDNTYYLYTQKFNTFLDYRDGKITLAKMRIKLGNVARAAKSYSDYSNVGVDSVNKAVDDMVKEYETEKHNYVGCTRMEGRF